MAQLFSNDKSARVKELKKRLKNKRFIDKLARKAVNNGGDFLSVLCKMGFLKPDWEAIIDENPSLEDEVINAINQRALERVASMKPIALMKAFETLVSILSGADISGDELKARVDAAKSVISASKVLKSIDGVEKEDEEFDDEQEIKKILGL